MRIKKKKEKAMEDNIILLEEVQRLRQNIEEVKKERQESKIFWDLWKYYAQYEPWYNEFIYDMDLRIPWEELKQLSKKKASIPDNFVSIEHGVRLWLERKSIIDKLTGLYGEVDRILQVLRDRKVKLKTIAPYYGSSEYAVHNYCQAHGITFVRENV